MSGFNESPTAIASFPYDVRDGCLYWLKIQKDEIVPIQIANFLFEITQEKINEDGERIFVLQGEIFDNKKTITMDVPVDRFMDGNALATTVVQAAGSSAIIHAGMARHLPAAIQSITTKKPAQIVEFTRTGWFKNRFLIPRLENKENAITLPPQLPYQANDQIESLPETINTLETLIHAQETEKLLVALTYIFQAPLDYLMGWQSERYGLFIAGRTGSFKTSIAMLLMSIYGSGFLNESALIKWGQGSTHNALISLATHASDMPILIDNFKPNTGSGTRDFINFIHAVVEGRDKARLKSSIQLRDSRPINCWPIITGEDIPIQDPAGLARILVLQMPKIATTNPNLTTAQVQGETLSILGTCWIKYLENCISNKVLQNDFLSMVPIIRDQWVIYFSKNFPFMVNKFRVATNLATNQTTWQMLHEFSIFKKFIEKYQDQYEKGLFMVAQDTATLLSENLEAAKFLEAIIELINSGKVKLRKKDGVETEADSRPVIGWSENDGSVYLVPNTAIRAAETIIGSEGLNKLSTETLYKQLLEINAIQSYDQGRLTKVIRVAGGGTQRVLHITAKSLGREK